MGVGKNKLVTGGQDATSFGFHVPLVNEKGKTISPEGTVFRSTLPISDIRLSPNGMQVAVAAHDSTISLVSLLDMGIIAKLEGHTSPVNSVDFASDSRYLASSSCDGTVKIWDMQMDEPTCVGTFTQLAPACQVGDETQQFKIRWSPDGSYLAVPGRAHDINLVKRGSWKTTSSLTNGHTSSITHLAWSPSGHYIASIAGDSRLVIWNPKKNSAVMTHTHSSLLCQVEWHPHSNALAFTDHIGSVSIWDNVISKEHHLNPHVVAKSTSFTLNSKPATSTKTAIEDLFRDDEAAVSKESNITDKGDVTDEEGESLGDDESLNDFVVDDGDHDYIEPTPQWTPPKHLKVSTFQPGSTPSIHGRRYLALNLIGSVVSIDQDADHNIIEIDFYDKSAHRDTHFRDTDKFSMASLSTQGCLFAAKCSGVPPPPGSTESSDSNYKPSFLSYRAYSSWSAVSNWMIRLPPSEDVECIALSPRGAATITSAGYLRLFTIGGVQRHIESLSSHVLSCSAFDDLLIIIFESTSSLAHSAMGTNEREYEYILMNINGSTRYCQGLCTLSKKSTLTWLHFTEEGHPVTCDSMGIIRILHRYWQPSQASWIPILDTRTLSRERGKKEAYWPVAISNSQLMTVTCKDGVKYPTYPKPILSEFNLRIPL